MSNDNTRLSVLIDDRDKEKLKEQADLLGLSFSGYVRMLLHVSATSDISRSKITQLFTNNEIGDHDE